MRNAAVVLAMLALGGCGVRESAPAPSTGLLGGDSVARVGTELVPGSLVAEVAARQGVPAPAALDRLIADALVAQGARQAGLDMGSAVRGRLDAVEAGLVVDHARDAAIAAGPPSNAEVDELTRLHWRDFDMPDQMLVIHAVVLRPKPANAAKEAAARAVAGLVATAEAGAKNASDFEARAKAVPHEGLDLRVERLDPFVADGRVVTSAGTYDAAFAAASAALAFAGATSGVVESSSGWHVIRLLERLPGKHVSLEERRVAFAEEARAGRAGKEMSALVSRLRRDARIEVVNGVDDLLTEAFGAAQSADVER